MYPFSSFIVNGDTLEVEELIELIRSWGLDNSELVLYFKRPPDSDLFKRIKHEGNATVIVSSNPKVSSLQKSLISAAGRWVIFTPVSNILNHASKIDLEISNIDSGYAICQMKPGFSRLLKKVGLRDISDTSYIAFDRNFASAHYSLTKKGTYDLYSAIKGADRISGIHFIHPKTMHRMDRVFEGNIIFMRPTIRIIFRYINRVLFWLYRKCKSAFKKSLIVVKDLIKGRRALRNRKLRFDPTIPVFIICRDRVEPLKKLVKWIEDEGLTNIILIDNDSSYPPLIKYYSETPHEVVRLGRNIGHTSPWTENIISTYASGRPFIVTDPDVIPDDNTHGAVKYFFQILNKYRRYVKVGFGLHIDNLPDHYDLKESVIVWEAQYWEKELEKDVYNAMTDTTFALYRPNTPYVIQPAIRSGRFQAMHEPWYINSSDLSEEVVYYRDHANKTVGTWGLKKGDLSDHYVHYEKSKNTK